MKNLDTPAMAIMIEPTQGEINQGLFNGGRIVEHQQFTGFTKREQACLMMGVPNSGDDDLNRIIKKGNLLKLSGLAMQGLAPNDDYTFKKCAEYSISHTTALLNLLYSIKSNPNKVETK